MVFLTPRSTSRGVFEINYFSPVVFILHSCVPYNLTMIDLVIHMHLFNDINDVPDITSIKKVDLFVVKSSSTVCLSRF